MSSLLPQLIAETGNWLVLNKPDGWLSIPGRLPGVPVVTEFAESHWGRVWTVHRLDKDTSGVILFARSAEAHRQANAWFQAHQVKKAYDCLAKGLPGPPVLRLNTPVNGAPSTTQITIQERFSASVLARAVPLTGRRHQIRIHLSGAGYPILGDVTYGGPKQMNGIEITRTALHAFRLELPSGERFEAPWPEDFSGWVHSLREGACV